MQNILVRHGERQRRSHQKANRTHKKTHMRSSIIIQYRSE